MQAKWITAALAAAMVCGTAGAQMKSMDSSSMANTGGNAAASSFENLLSMMESEVVGVAEAMPADKYDFAPSQAIFKESQKTDFTSPKPVRGFGDQVKHLAQANYFFFTAPGAHPPAEAKAISGMKSKAEIVAALKKSFEYAHSQVAMLTPANAFDETKAEGHPSTRVANIAFGLAHMNDHYGQLVEYLRMNGIVPPASRR